MVNAKLAIDPRSLLPQDVISIPAGNDIGINIDEFTEIR